MDRMTELALQYGRYGYREIARFLRDEGFAASPKRVERLWRREGLVTEPFRILLSEHLV